MTESIIEHPAIAELFDHWQAAGRAGDAERLASLVTEDAEFWTPGLLPIRGRDAVRAAFPPVFAQYEVDQEFTCQEFIVSGDWAFARGLEVNRATPRGGGEAIVRRQRAFMVLRRDEEDGQWRFARGMTHLPPEGE
jgi:uncharacterized protein (TIGR02246 family)